MHCHSHRHIRWYSHYANWNRSIEPDRSNRIIHDMHPSRNNSICNMHLDFHSVYIWNRRGHRELPR